MWTCPTCGREFKNAHQDHACGEPPTAIDSYIAVQPESVRPLLHQVRDTLRALLPDAEERMTWRMPTYWKKRNIIHFAAFKNHIGLYPGRKAMEHFADKLSEYKTSKGAVQFPYSKPFPFELMEEIAKWCYVDGHQ